MTDLSNEDIANIKKRLETENPRDLKMQLGHIIVEMYYNTEEADKAQAEFVNVVQNKGVPSDVPEYKIVADTTVAEIVMTNKLVESKGELKRLAAQGGLKMNDEKCSDINTAVTLDMLPVVLKVGKRKFCKVLK